LVSPAAMLISYENHKGKLSTVPSAMYVDWAFMWKCI
jgi:hypothetical protein